MRVRTGAEFGFKQLLVLFSFTLMQRNSVHINKLRGMAVQRNVQHASNRSNTSVLIKTVDSDAVTAVVLFFELEVSQVNSALQS